MSSGESKEEEVMGEGIGESEIDEVDKETKGADSRKKGELVKHNERSDQTMKMAKQE